MSEVPIYTIGYGAREIGELIAVLQSYDIEYLIDVRSKPYSRYKPDFSKKALEQHLKANNIRYVFMGDSLGGQPDDPDCYTNKRVDYDRVKEKPFYQNGIKRLQDAYQQQLRVALMCSEGKPEQCHRAALIGKTLSELHIRVIHIDENNSDISQEDLWRERVNKGQLSLPGMDVDRKTSRKRYSQSKDE